MKNKFKYLSEFKSEENISSILVALHDLNEAYAKANGIDINLIDVIK